MDAMYHSGSGRNTKWVCPNDRQLALRAKLKTGWSVKSSSLDSRYDDYNQYSSSYPGNLSSTSNSNKNVPLTDDERQRIIEVIQRAEALDQSEQERVGKLVERLDNMKRNVSMVTSTRSNGRNCGSRCIRGNKCICCCALCGEKFTVLGAGPTLCRDCRKYVCQKCGVETTTAAVAPISNAKNSQTDRQQRPISASIGNLSSLESLVNVNPPSTPPTKVFLCRICTETREMWKKSGAWFFKSLPKYILPEKKKPRSGSKCAAWTLTGSSRSLEPAELTQDSSSDEDITRGNGTHRRLFVSSSLSSEPGESASTQKRFETLVEVHNKRGSSLDLNNALIENEIKSVSLQLQPSTPNLLSPGQLIVPIISSTLTSPTSPLSPLSPSRSSNRLRDQRDKMTTGSGSSQSSTFLRQFAIGSSESVDRESTDSGTKKKQSCQSVSGNSSNDKINQIRGVGSTLESTDPTSSRYHATASRRQSINSDSNVSEMMDSRKTCVSNSQHDHDPNQPLIYRQMDLNVAGMDEEKNYGTLEIALRYEPNQTSHCLQCKLIRARALRPMDIHGLADPFCVLNILPIDPESNTTMKLRSKTVLKTRDPEFNEQLNFYAITESDMMSEKALHIMILQDDEAGRDFLGEAKFPLRELRPYQTKFYNVSLMEHYQVDQEENAWGDELSNGRGRIFLSLNYNTNRRALQVHVQRAMNLLAMDSNGLSDPFVKVRLLMPTPQREDNPIKMNQVHTTKSLRESFTRSLTKHQSKQGKKLTKNTLLTHTTKVKWNTLNPEWNEELSFETQLNDLSTLALVLTVWDKDFGKKNDFLGSLVLSCNSKGARLRQWINVMKFPDHQHEASHELCKETTLFE
ncbi:hypothetical protein PV327_006522 [Microctonus hyperodae]|uniref:Rabphilin n=1 Tax=Microctonus hyperodae TaxID=165561 RepID=A0AA39KIC9_MICHY|nr:hypothetical protein PV327_006522 [Microctonus hyperodae]